MKVFRSFGMLCLLLCVLAGCGAAEPIHTELPPETAESVTAQFSMIESEPAHAEPAVSAVIQPVTTVQVSSELSVTIPVTTEVVAEKLAASAPVTTAPQAPESVPDSLMVPILMFHDVKTYAGGTWSMSADNFRKRMEFLLDNGYTPVTFEQLADYVDGAASLPQKPVCITFDDGYYSNYKNVLPIVTELQIPITVFVICGAVRPEGVEPDANEEALSMMSAGEIAQMEASPFVQVQSHTYDLHIVGYGEDGKRGDVLPLASEDASAYKKMFAEDCTLAEAVLTDVGVTEHIVFSYPGGKYHRLAESVLKERGYRMSLTTDFGHRNLVVAGDPESLYLLGRMNVNDETTDKELLAYLSRK